MSFRRMRHVKAREFQGCQFAVDAATPSMYDATSGGALVAADGAVSRIDDLSGNSRHATQTSTARPIRKAALWSGLDVLRFDGSNDTMIHGASSGSDPCTLLFAGVKRASQTGYRGLISYGNSNNTNGAMILLSGGTNFIGAYAVTGWAASTFSPSVDAGFVVTHKVASSSAMDWTANGSSAGSSVLDSSSQSAAHIGGYATVSQCSQVDMFEAAIWNVNFSSAAQKRLDLSRCRKWRIAS